MFRFFSFNGSRKAESQTKLSLLIWKDLPGFLLQMTSKRDASETTGWNLERGEQQVVRPYCALEHCRPDSASAKEVFWAICLVRVRAQLSHKSQWVCHISPWEAYRDKHLEQSSANPWISSPLKAHQRVYFSLEVPLLWEIVKGFSKVLHHKLFGSLRGCSSRVV